MKTCRFHNSNKTIVSLLFVIGIFAGCSVAQPIPDLIDADEFGPGPDDDGPSMEPMLPQPPSDMTDQLNKSVFPECIGLGPLARLICFNNSFRDFLEALDLNIEKCFPNGSFEYVTSCPSCPPDRRCVAADGLCVPRTDVGLQAGFTMPSIFQDCEEPDEECRRFTGTPECTEELPEGSDFDTSTCTCFDLGGEYLAVGACLNQCGTFITAADPGPQSGFPGPGPVSVCCRPYRECTDFYEKYCFDGSACFRPQCDGQGNIFCETGQDLVEVDDPPEICKN